ncbi:MAG: TIGR01548 family HAD-type hydrolase [Phycisphaerales bacterium]|jgi:histidinol-phosphate aminotransferase|nr:TIGR01548 family HAD-type hydrolase [Phycisphaerales bacterium]
MTFIRHDGQPALRPAARLADVRAYAPPTPRWAIDLRLDANEGPAPTDPVLDEVRGVDAEDLRRHPDARPLERDIADAWRIDANRVVVTNGGDDAIDRVCRAFLEPGCELLMHAPSFEMIPRSARLAGADVRMIGWQVGEFPEAALCDAITSTTGVVALVTPNNPTGGVIDAGMIARIADRAREVGAVVLLDLAYVEFAETDPTGGVLGRDNVVVVRTFSKALGLAGMRVGYAIAPVEVAPWLRAAGGPYPVSSVSLAAARRAWADRTTAKQLGIVCDERARLIKLCAELDLEPLPSQANFVTIRSRRAAWIYEALGSLGISVRLLKVDGENPWCRITLPGCAAKFEGLAKALRAAGNPQAILFDLDGVLADVSGSYHATIIRTASEFGITLTADDVSREKANGNANNDWVLTWRLLAARGADVSLEAVTRVFQRIYLGDAGVPGLRESERLIPSRAWLEAIRRCLPLAVVTGRPRDEAAWLLDRFGVRDCFETLVAMEDAPAKPSPEPVVLALQRLGITRAWMIGDTPDDAVAARAAGVVPIGITAPGDGPGTLERAGVARVLEDLSRLEELLP